MTGSAGMGLFAALGVTLGLCLVAAWLLRRLTPGAVLAGRGLPLRVLQRTSLGPKQGVALVQVGKRVLVVSTAENGASLLAELDGEDRDHVLTPIPSAASPVVAGAVDVRALLGGVARAARGGAGLLALAATLAFGASFVSPSPAHAQHITAPAPVKGAVAKVPPATPARVASGLQAPVVSPPPMPQVDIRIGEGKDAIRLSGAVGLVIFLGVLTLLPALFLLMTSFTRILIVLHFLRSAMGTQTVPPGQVLVALAVLLTGVVMHPVLEETNRTALQPYFAGQIEQAQAYNLALQPFRGFMLRNVREQDLTTFAEMSGIESVRDENELPTIVVVSAFVISELRTAFQMGFVLYLPFVVVDVVVASVLMSLGMFMLPPVMISMPLKLLLFVLADGWTLVVQNLVGSFK
ncbi:MAG: flagellar type III secretion system pore protein FliP [Candidatus Eisenbacteria bacterium]|nr:flagellar type III secretion system pore protein FliP [Candidatus Eisenbacteria bacterium]